MSNWIKQHIDLGTINVSDKQKIVFKAKKPLNIQKVSASCDCSTPRYDANSNQVTVSYVPKNIPKHLQTQGWYTTTKSIYVYYNDGTKDILSFTAKITR